MRKELKTQEDVMKEKMLTSLSYIAEENEDGAETHFSVLQVEKKLS